MTLRDHALEMLRSEERLCLEQLTGPDETGYAYTLTPLSRELYAGIETPPTDDPVFIIRTFWRTSDWTATSHGVFVATDGRCTQVIAARPGAFGA